MIRAALLSVLLMATPAAAQDWRSITTMRQLSGEEMLRVDIEYGAGRFEVSPGVENLLYRANLRYDADVFRPVTSYSNGRLRLAFEGGSLKGRNLRAGHLDVRLGPSVPLDLALKFGAAEAALELGGLRIREAQISTGASKTMLRVSRPNLEVCRMLRIEVGAAQFRAEGLGNLNAERLRLTGGVGEVTLDFSGRWRQDLTADIEMGLGSLSLRVPRGLGVRVRKSGILAGFDSQGLVKRGDVYFSENWEDAEHRLTVNIDAALGSIRFAWVDGYATN